MVMGPDSIYANVTHLFLELDFGKDYEKSLRHKQKKIKDTLYDLENAQTTLGQSHNTLTGQGTI